MSWRRKEAILDEMNANKFAKWHVASILFEFSWHAECNYIEGLLSMGGRVGSCIERGKTSPYFLKIHPRVSTRISLCFLLSILCIMLISIKSIFGLHPFSSYVLCSWSMFEMQRLLFLTLMPTRCLWWNV